MNINIDSRETKIIDEMNKINFSKEYEYTICNLILGDFIIKTENLELIIERKTESDLISSILDGRFREQKTRLIEYLKNNQKTVFVIYLIEQGSYSKKFEKQMESAIINLTFKYDNFKVVYSKSIEKSVGILLNICKKIKDGELMDGTFEINKNSIIPKMKKGENYSAFEKMLCCIDGISPKIAKSITNTGIDSIKKLQTELQKESGYNSFKDIQISEKRKISKLLFEKIKKEF